MEGNTGVVYENVDAAIALDRLLNLRCALVRFYNISTKRMSLTIG